MLHYERAVETKRPAGSRRIEVFSPKIKRRLTLFSRDSHDAWLLLEADPTVRTFCERPAYLEGDSGRVLHFWVEQGGYDILAHRMHVSMALLDQNHGLMLEVRKR